MSLAVALLGRPTLVLDEPTVGLDPVLRRDLWTLFHRLAADGTACWSGSHVMDEAARCDRLLLMRAGRVLADDTPAGLLAATGTADIEAAFLSEGRGRDERPAAHRGPLVRASRTLATAGRVLRQIRHDPRTIALLLIVPSLLIGLVAWIFSDTTVLRDGGPAMIALFPFIVMFLVTRITTLRDARSGTLERLLTMPLGNGDLILGYALAFGLLAVLQSSIAALFAVTVCGLDIDGSLWQLVAVAVADAILGTTLGLLASAFAQTEFQVVQFMPLLVFPQILLGGMFLPRDQLPDVLYAISNGMPLSYAVDALQCRDSR